MTQFVERRDGRKMRRKWNENTYLLAENETGSHESSSKKKKRKHRPCPVARCARSRTTRKFIEDCKSRPRPKRRARKIMYARSVKRRLGTLLKIPDDFCTSRRANVLLLWKLNFSHRGKKRPFVIYLLRPRKFVSWFLDDSFSR